LFYADDSIEYGAYMEKKFHDIEVKEEKND
jgi:ribosome-binding factor A